MGKNHRHKKQLKTEKAKTKLKSEKTKFLPKGQNVTNISFKVKPIVLPEQLRLSTSSDPLSTRKLSLKDVLSRLKHHNVLIKVDNLQQLKELIGSYSTEVLRQNLAQVLQGVCPLMLDVEHKVRNEAVKVLRRILSGIAPKDVEAFFHVFSTYLRCSMTHIDPNIQEDSLLLLDALLEQAPSLVALNTRQILPNFFTLISKLKSSCKPGRTLTQNLKSKQTSVRWRVKVLSSLKGIFEAMHSHELGSVRVDLKASVCVKPGALYVDKYTGCPINFFSDETIEGDAEEPMADYIKTLLPLLHETWMEVAPDLPPPGPLSESVVLKQDASDTLTCILEVLYFCWCLAEALDRKNNSSQVRQAFRLKTMRDLLDSLLKTFPYSQAQQKKGESQEKCLRENLLVCYVFCVTHSTKKPQGKSKIIMNYVNYCLSNRNYVNPENVGLLFSLLKVIWKDKQLIGNTLRFYQQYSKKLATTDAVDLLVLLCDSIQDFGEANDDISALMKGLPKLLLGPEVHAKTLNFLLMLVKRDLATARGCFQQTLKAVLDNSLRIKIVDGADTFLGVIQILSLYYYVPLSQGELEILTQFGADNPKYSNFVNYVVNAKV